MYLDINEKCWCGSEKKYKDCHFEIDRKLSKMSKNYKMIVPHLRALYNRKWAFLAESPFVGIVLLRDNHIGEEFRTMEIRMRPVDFCVCAVVRSTGVIAAFIEVCAHCFINVRVVLQKEIV